MRIDSLKLVDFRSHRGSQVEFEQLNLIAGRNASGKSSLIYALEYALTGKCDATDKAGRGAEDLIRVGQEGACVQVVMNSLRISRSIPSRFEISENETMWPGGIRELQAALYDRLQVDSELLAACLNCSRITGWSAADIKSVAFPLLGVGQDAVQDALVDWLTIHAEGNICLLDLAAKYAAFTDLDARFDAIFKARKEAKKIRDKAQADLDAEGDMVTPDREKLATMEAQLAQRKAERDELIERRGAAQHSQQEADRLDSEIASVAAELKELNGLPEIKVPPIPAADYMEEMRGQRRDETQRGEAMRTERDELTAELRQLDIALAGLKKGSADCPVVPGMKCGMTAEQKKKATEDIKKRQKAKAENHAQLQATVAESQVHQKEMESHIADLEAITTEAQKAQGEREQRDKIRATLTKRLSELQERTSAAPVDTKALDEEIEALSARIGTGESLIAVARVDVQKADRQKVLRAAVEEAARLAEDYELLVKAFGPDGFRANLLEGGIGPLEARVNENLQMLTRGEYSVQIDGADFRVFVAHGGCTVELKHLSASEQVRIGLALTEALVYQAGLGLVVLDACEVLDGPNKNRLISWAMQRKADHQIILLATSEDPKSIEGMKVFKCEAGSVEEVVMANA